MLRGTCWSKASRACGGRYVGWVSRVGAVGLPARAALRAGLCRAGHAILHDPATGDPRCMLCCAEHGCALPCLVQADLKGLEPVLGFTT